MITIEVYFHLYREINPKLEILNHLYNKKDRVTTILIITAFLYKLNVVHKYKENPLHWVWNVWTRTDWKRVV